MRNWSEAFIISVLVAVVFVAGLGAIGKLETRVESFRIQKVEFAGVWYDYYGNHVKGAFYTPGSRVPFAFLEDGRITKNGADELIGDVEGLRFETR